MDTELINQIKVLLDGENPFVKVYRMAKNTLEEDPHVKLNLQLIGKRDKDGRTYNLPSSSEVAALIVGDITNCANRRDIMVQTQSGKLLRISELHPSYLPLQYPLLFPFGDDGYRVDIPHRDLPSDVRKKIKKHNLCTMREFFAYRIQDKEGIFSLIHNSKRLFQQFLVDAYTMIESERLYFIRGHQKNLRCESFEKLKQIKGSGVSSMSGVGTKVILPSSFTGGARYMIQNYLDAMSICKWFGYPDFFITITCNPKWPEVKRFLKDTTLNSEDRPDILCRLFKIKLDAVIKDLKEKSILGKVIGGKIFQIDF